MPNDETIHVEYDTTGVPSPLGTGEKNYSENLSIYFYNKMNTIGYDGDFTVQELNSYGLELVDNKIDISTTKKLIKYLKSLIKKNASDFNSDMVNVITSNDVDDELKDSPNPIANSAVFRKFGEIIDTITNNYNSLLGKIGETNNDLNNKANAVHTHSMNDITNLNTTINAINNNIDTKASTSSLNSHISNRNNPHGVTLAQLGITDSGVMVDTRVSPYTNAAYITQNDIKIRKWGKVVTIDIPILTLKADVIQLNGENDAIRGLPEGFRPTETIFTFGTVNGAIRAAAINPNGAIVFGKPALKKGDYIRLHISYIVS